MDKLYFAGADWLAESGDFDEDLREALLSCATPGQSADGAVAYLRDAFDVAGSPADCAAYLKGYGAWTNDELADHDANLGRLVWLTGCALGDGESASFSTY